MVLAVDVDRASLGEVERELRERYERDYRVLTADSSRAALALLEKIADAGEDVALVLAAQWLDEMSGSDLLGQVRAFDPYAQRGLLIDWASWGDGRTGEALFHGMARRAGGAPPRRLRAPRHPRRPQRAARLRDVRLPRAPD